LTDSTVASELTRDLSLSVFFPCYDDAPTIGIQVERVDAVIDRLGVAGEIIVVNDGSRDRSAEVLESLRASTPRLRVVTHDENRGYGAALQSGFTAASGTWVFYTDGDGQYDPDQLERLCALACDDVDVVQGYKLERSDNVCRRVVGRLYHRVVSLLFGLHVRDTDCDFRLIRGAALRKIRLEQRSGAICVELVRKLQTSGARFVEVGVDHYPRVNGRSQFFRPRHLARTATGLAHLWMTLVMLRREAPASPDGRRRLSRRAAAILPWFALLAATFGAALRVPAGRADEAWFLWVAERANHGAALYRGVYYVTTPLAMWVMQLATRVFGSHIAVERALTSTCFVGSAALLCAIARRYGVGRPGRIALVLALLVFGSPLAHFASVYSVLAVALSLAALLATLRWLDAVRSSGWPASGPLGAGFLCGTAFATKPNTGLLALAAVAVTAAFAIRERPGRTPTPGRALASLAGGFSGAVLVMLVPLTWSGTLGPFVGDVFTGKGRYVSLLGAHALNSVSYALHLLGASGAPLAHRLIATDLFLPILVPLLLMALVSRARAVRTSPEFVALVAFSMVGVGSAAPDFGPQHVTEVVPLLFGLPAVLTVWTLRSQTTISGRVRRRASRPVFLSATALAAAAVAIVGVYAQRPAVRGADRVVAADLAHFDGTMISAVSQTQVHADLRALRSATRGSVFIVEPGAAFYYLAGGLRNPTPYDFPARTDLGADGQSGALALLQRRHTRWVCIPKPVRRVQTVSSTAPLELERGIQHSYHFFERLHFCDLYVAKAPTAPLVDRRVGTSPDASVGT
jgi:hypothetical protein